MPHAPQPAVTLQLLPLPPRKPPSASASIGRSRVAL
jgi:hypothetical protein